MPVHIEEMTSEVTVFEGDLPLSDKQTEALINKVMEPWVGVVLAKVAVLVAIMLFIQRRPRGLGPLGSGGGTGQPPAADRGGRCQQSVLFAWFWCYFDREKSNTRGLCCNRRRVHRVGHDARDGSAHARSQLGPNHRARRRPPRIPPGGA